MACNTATLNGIEAQCHTATGGIKRILIANRDNVEIGAPDADGVINSINLLNNEYFRQWFFRKNTGNFTTSLTSDPTIGTLAVTTELNLQFTKVEARKRLEIQSAINAAAVVIVELQDKDEDKVNQYILLGYDNEVSITSVNMQSGTAVTDLNGFTLTFQDVSVELPYFVDASIIKNLTINPAEPAE